MGDPTFENRTIQGRLVHVGIEVVTAHIGEIDDIRFSDRVAVGGEGHADFLILEVQPEGVNWRFRPGCSRLMAGRDGRNRIRVPLNGGALQVMAQSTQSSHFLSTTCATGSPVHQLGHGAAMACALLGTSSVQYENAPVVGRSLDNELAGCSRVCSHDAAAEGPLAHVGHGDGVVQVVVGKQTGHRTKWLHRMDLLSLHWTVMGKQTRRVESTGSPVAPHQLIGFHRQKKVGFLSKFSDGHLHFPALFQASQCPHAHLLQRGIAHLNLVQLPFEGIPDRLEVGSRHHRPAHRSAPLTAFDGHLLAQLFDEQVKLCRARRSIGPENKAVEGIGLHIEWHVLRKDPGMGFQLQTGRGRTGECDDIFEADVIQDVTGTPAHQLEGALRQNARSHDFLDHCMRHIGSDGGGLHQGRHTCEQIDTHLLKHAPDGEIVRIDVHGHPALGHTDVVPDESPTSGKQGWITIHEVGEVRELFAEACVCKQGSDASFHINPGIRARGSRMCAPLVEFFLLLHQMQRQGLQHQSALLKRHAPQCAAPDLPCMVKSPRQINV